MSLAQLQRLLPLPEADLQQVLDYAATLSKQEAAEHFNNLLGESPGSIEFISSFNSRRRDPNSSKTPTPAQAPSQSESSSGVPKPVRAQKKKKPPLHTPAPRAIHEAYAAQGRAYKKDDELDYIPKKPTSTFALTSQPEAAQAPIPAPTPRAPPSAAGTLISDFKTSKAKSASNSAQNSRTSSPAPQKTKINITGGTPMQGASSSLTELDSAIRSLEIQTNPSRSDNAARACNCIATRHPLLAAAPNCLNCGKVICVKEGLGPCTFCGTPLLSSDQIQGMIRSLKDERGKEKMALDAASHKRAQISRVPAPFSNPRAGGPTPSEQGLTAAEIKAKEHRDRLLGFQSQNAKRTTVHDEAADFEIPTDGTSLWGSASERARQLKQQQKVLRELEWNARPEWEKRREVLSIDVVGGKVVRRMGRVERPAHEDDNDHGSAEEDVNKGNGTGLAQTRTDGNSGGGTFSHNPLLGSLIRPVWKPTSSPPEGGDPKGKEKGKGKGKAVDLGADAEVRADGETQDENAVPRKKAWRRVQDDYEDNEEIILDGGVYGGKG